MVRTVYAPWKNRNNLFAWVHLDRMFAVRGLLRLVVWLVEGFECGHCVAMNHSFLTLFRGSALTIAMASQVGSVRSQFYDTYVSYDGIS